LIPEQPERTTSERLPSPRQNYDAVWLAWVGERIAVAERQGLTLNYLGGWQTYKPDPKTLGRARRALYGIPDAMTHLFTSPQEQWEQVLLRWLRHHEPAQDRGGPGTGGGGTVCGDGGGRVPGTRWPLAYIHCT
jgi:hypothetical protein